MSSVGHCIVRFQSTQLSIIIISITKGYILYHSYIVILKFKEIHRYDRF